VVTALAEKETKMRRSKVPAVVVCLALGLGGQAVADGSQKAAQKPAKSLCHDVDATFTSDLAADGCTSPLGLCAAGRVRNDALLKGTMFVTLEAAAPAAGLPSTSPFLLSVNGGRVLTPRRGGTLTASVVGVFDQDPASPALGHFVELNVITGGTGLFAGATGVLHVSGQPTGPTSFAGQITGQVCLAR
jgi:hypothetical protein